jgi:HTH-type transcriptional regulator, transcriptional repressor of NAD biosynthesis genes
MASPVPSCAGPSKVRFRSGLIVGKFCPLHRGHQFLIETAMAQCERVIVISYTKPDIPGYNRGLREQWLQSLYPNVISLVVDDAWLAAQKLQGPFHLVPYDDDPEDDHRRFTAWLCYGVLGETVEAIFTSEDYGDGFADVLSNWFQAYAGTSHRVVHVCVDKTRAQVPISGTQIRENFWQSADHLAPEIRASFVKRVAVLGGESTGKTTLCQALAARLQSVWVPEYGRELWIEKGGSLEFTDMVKIAERQITDEEKNMPRAIRWLVCDTSPLTTMFYSEAMFGSVDTELVRLADRHYDHILVCTPEFEFVQDGTRQDTAFRDRQHHWYLEKLEAQALPYSFISGSLQDRVKQSIALLNSVYCAGTT